MSNLTDDSINIPLDAVAWLQRKNTICSIDKGFERFFNAKVLLTRMLRFDFDNNNNNNSNNSGNTNSIPSRSSFKTLLKEIRDGVWKDKYNIVFNNACYEQVIKSLLHEIKSKDANSLMEHLILSKQLSFQVASLLAQIVAKSKDREQIDRCMLCVS